MTDPAPDLVKAPVPAMTDLISSQSLAASARTMSSAPLLLRVPPGMVAMAWVKSGALRWLVAVGLTVEPVRRIPAR